MRAEGSTQSGMHGEYHRLMLEIRRAFDAGGSGGATIAARAIATDALVSGLWEQELRKQPRLARNVCVLAVAGYGRRELFPCSDVDLLFLLDTRLADDEVKNAVRNVCRELWDCGIRASPGTRGIAECEAFDAENAEFTMSLLDLRRIAGSKALYARLAQATLPRMLAREHRAIGARLKEMADTRHARYGNTLFHLEPNIKECPGGLRDVHVCGWLARLRSIAESRQKPTARGLGMTNDPAFPDDPEFREAVEFLHVVRCFLHYRHDRDDNTLDWLAQDAAAEAGIGLAGRSDKDVAGAAYWMRIYFRHARSVERRVMQMLEEVPLPRGAGRRLGAGLQRPRPGVVKPGAKTRGYKIEHGRIALGAAGQEGDPAHDPDIALQVFAAMAGTGCVLGREAEARLSQALPLLSSHLEEGPALWNSLRSVLLGRFAGRTLRAMHALGILELLIPEFHGIDALVIRDAYHRYTVDEHTFVLIDTLHGLEGFAEQEGPGLGEWPSRFAAILKDLQHVDLLFLVALLHDTGKGRSKGDHTIESGRMARSVLSRLELDTYESGLVTSLIENHLEMSAALRRDIFDTETVQVFAGKVQTPEALRMLTLFTYADINAVHPDALTPWKAENLWRLYIATSNFLDRNVDEERVGVRGSELVRRVTELLPKQRAEIAAFLEGFPERYLLTRTPDQVRMHFEMAKLLDQDPVQLNFRYAPEGSEITLVARDRKLLFATMAGALAAWGMNIVTADAFSNRAGIVVDSFHFTDSFRTLEMNASEHAAFVESVHGVVMGLVSLEKLLGGRRRGRRNLPKVTVEARLDFDNDASSHSTLLQVVAQDTPGLLYALSVVLADRGCNIEVALVDTEGETAIDVFYLTRNGAKLDGATEEALRRALLDGIGANSR